MNKKIIPAYLLSFVNVIGYSILLPILPFIVESYSAPKWVFGLLLTLYSTFQFFGAPYLGAISDSLGRKPVLLISQAGTLLSWFLFIIAILLPDYKFLSLALPLWIIALSRILDGITGGNISVTNAYVADIISKKERSYIFGYLGGVAGVGMIVGPGIGGLAASTSLGYIGTILAAIIISTITLITIILWLKESLPIEKRTVKKNQSFLYSFLILKRIKELDPSPIIKLIFLLKLIFSTMMAFYVSSIALFLIDLFKFDEKELGFFMFVVGLFLALNQAFVSKPFIKKFGEFNTLMIGLTLTVIGLFSITLTDNLWIFIAYYYVINLGISLCFPTFNALVAIYANPEKYGEIMGISESISSITMAAFPVISTAMYGLIKYELYYLISLLPFIALIIALFNKNRIKEYKNKF